MRLPVVLAALSVSLLSISTDICRASLISPVCRWGWCRFDQIFLSIDSTGLTLGNSGELLAHDPRNPYVWCVFGDTLAEAGERARATAAFDHAVELGPDMPPALMRAANYYFTHGETAKATAVSRTVLLETDAFDQILFSYFRLLKLPASQLLGTAVPASAPAAKAYLDWVRAQGSDADLVETWTWMKENGLLDRASAAGALWTLWYRQSYAAAHRLWLELLAEQAGSPGTAELFSNLLSNPDFAQAPQGGPFDWSLEAPRSVRVTRQEGMEVRFLGTENLAFSGVRQGVFLEPGRYRFTAEVESQALTTDQTPFFHLFDPARPEAVQFRSPQIKGSTPRSRLSLLFEVPRGSQAMVVQLDRQPSLRFDNRIAGALHVYHVSIERVRP